MIGGGLGGGGLGGGLGGGDGGGDGGGGDGGGGEGGGGDGGGGDGENRGEKMRISAMCRSRSGPGKTRVTYSPDAPLQLNANGPVSTMICP